MKLDIDNSRILEEKAYSLISGKDFLYNKPINPREIKYPNGRKKFEKLYANRKDRRLVKTWLKGDMENPTPTHDISKSILWEIW